jgi:hypothetical protein
VAFITTIIKIGKLLLLFENKILPTESETGNNIFPNTSRLTTAPDLCGGAPALGYGKEN